MNSTARKLLALALALPCAAQNPRFDTVHRLLPSEAGPLLPWGAVATGDIDGDGLEDLVCVARWNPSSGYVPLPSFAWVNTPGGRFVELPNAMPQILRRAVVAKLVDLDGDGDRDCVVLHEPETATPCTAPYGVVIPCDLLWNDGTGHFSLASSALPVPSHPKYTCMAVGDVDGDGDVDIVAGTHPHVCLLSPPAPFPASLALGEDHLFTNLGGGVFGLGVGRLPPFADFTDCLQLADFDSDGDLDLFVGLDNAPSRLYANNGLGYFVEMVGALPLNTRATTAQAGDLDGDGDPDLLIRDSGMMGTRWLRNNNGAFVDATSFLPGAPQSAGYLLAELNGDQHLDLAVTSTTGTATTTTIYLNQGGVGFVAAATRPIAPGLAMDLEADNDLDLVSLYGPYRVERNLGAAGWDSVGPDHPAMLQPVMALADIDNDGDLDGLAPCTIAGPGRILRNQGAGVFVEAQNGALSTDTVPLSSLVVADFDNDGDPDVFGVYFVGGSPGAGCRLFLNTGGVLQLAPLPVVRGQCAAAGDLDLDGDVDLYVGDALGGDVVMRNDGQASFTLQPVGLQNVTSDVALADLDGDGDLDVALASGVYPTRVLRNTGGGTFVATSFTTPAVSMVEAADFDGDGDVDLVFGGVQVTGGVQGQLYRNDGTGGFAIDPAGIPPAMTLRTGLRCFDVDLDGDVDLIYSDGFGFGSTQVHVLVNSGSGMFTEAANALVDLLSGAGLVGDLDGDRDLDSLAYASWGPLVYWNLHHQLRWRDLPRIGRILTMDLDGRANEPFALGISLTSTRLAVPGIGTLWLDPASLQLAHVGAYDGGGHASFAAPVPFAVGLIGLPVHWQALSGVQPLLGNLETTTLRAR